MSAKEYSNRGDAVLGESLRLSSASYTEVQRVSFVGYTGGEGGSPGLWNLQNLHAVPPYASHVVSNRKISYPPISTVQLPVKGVVLRSLWYDLEEFFTSGGEHQISEIAGM